MGVEFSHLVEQASRYPYFCTVLGGTLLVAAITVLLKEHRREILLSGMAGALPGATAPAFESSYWNPVRLGGGPLGIEDLLCGFMVTSFIWAGHCVAFQEERRVMGSRVFWWRCLILGIPSALPFLTLYWLRWDGLFLAIVQPLTILAVVLWWRPSLWPFCLSGLFSFAVFWWASLRICFWISPGFLQQWNLDAWFGVRAGGVPLGEVLWAACLGACWPVFMIWCLEGANVTREAPP